MRIITLGIVLSLSLGGGASAAPQILGLLATATPMPLICADGMCAAQFSTFCLQPDRTAPKTGRAYRPAQGTTLTLRFTGPDGAEHSLSVGKHATIEALREFHAVRIAIPESDIRAFGGRNPAIAVGPLASLVPVARPDDLIPLDAREIAFITGPHREAVESVLDAKTTVAAQTVSRLIVALPEGRTTVERRASVWREVMGDTPTPASSAGLRTAERDFQYCKRWADTGRGYGLRLCLEEMHDAMTSTITNKAWAVTQPGS